MRHINGFVAELSVALRLKTQVTYGPLFEMMRIGAINGIVTNNCIPVYHSAQEDIDPQHNFEGAEPVKTNTGQSDCCVMPPNEITLWSRS